MFLHNQNWDNLRFVLAVADQGSVNAAARLLGVNHATVLRRVAAFESEHGGAVFEKTAIGYRVLSGRTGVIDAAREVENAVLAVERLMHGSVAPLRGVVRVSSTDTICQILLPPLVARLHAESSELQIDVLSNNSHLDFARMQADISVRPAPALPDDMTGEAGAELVFFAYGAPDCGRHWLKLSGQLERSAAAVWMAANISDDDIVMGADSFLVLREMAKAGTGIAVLPAYVGDTARGLERLPGLMPRISVPIWVSTHKDMRDVPRIHVVRKRILSYLGTRARIIDGSG